MEGVIRMLTLVILCTNMLNSVAGLMVMDEASCHEAEEEECGLCHTVYMEECSMKEVEEMRPMKKRMCRPRQECKMEMVVEEMRPMKKRMCRPRQMRPMKKRMCR